MNYLCLWLLVCSLVLIEFLAAGTRLVFSLPAYGILALAGTLVLFSRGRPPGAPGWQCLAASAVFLGYILVRCLTSPVEYLVRADFFLVLGSLLAYLLVAFYVAQPKLRLLLVVGFLCLGAVQIAIGAVQYFRREPFQVLSFIEPADYGARASGLFICPNHLAGFLEVVTLMGLSAAIWSRWPGWLKAAAGYVSLVCLVGIVLTGSRAGCLSVFFGLLVLLGLSLITLWKGNIGRKWQLGLCLLLVGGVLTAAVVKFSATQFALKSRWAKIGEGDIRPALWQAAIKQFQLSPILGTGSGTYLYYGRLFRDPQTLADPVYVHNDYLQLLAEYGLVGLGAFGLFLALHLRSGIRCFNGLIAERVGSLGRIQSDTLAVNIGALAVVAAYAVHSLFDFNLHIPANALILAMVFGMLASPSVARHSEPGAHSRAARYARFLLPVPGLAVMIISVLSLPAEYFTEKSRVAVKNERYVEAIEAAHRGLRYSESNPYLFLYLGQAHFEMGALAENPEAAKLSFTVAARAFDKGLALFPQERELLLGAGRSLDALQKFDEAEPYYVKAVTWDPNSHQIHFFHGRHLHAAGRLDRAAEAYQKSMQLHWNLAALSHLEQLAQDRQAAAGATNPK